MTPEELIFRWRTLADARADDDETIPSPSIPIEVELLRECADQLEAALAPKEVDRHEGDPMYHTFLVGLVVGPEPSREAAEKQLHTMLPHPEDPRGDLGPSWVDCWWIAEDERYDRSDTDSAVFVPSNVSQQQAATTLQGLSDAVRQIQEVTGQTDKEMKENEMEVTSSKIIPKEDDDDINPDPGA